MPTSKAMTVKETLARLKALGNEKVRKHNTKNGASENSSASNTVTSGSWLPRSRPTTSWPSLCGRPGTPTLSSWPSF